MVVLHPPSTTETAPLAAFRGHEVRLSVAVTDRTTSADTVAVPLMVIAPVVGLMAAMFSPTIDMLYVTGPLPSGDTAVTV